MTKVALYCCSIRKRNKAGGVIPNGVVKIGKEAFYWNKSLTSLVLPASVTELEEGCFENCVNLKQVTFSEGLKIIGAKAFSGDEELEYIEIPLSVEEIGGWGISVWQFL